MTRRRKKLRKLVTYAVYDVWEDNEPCVCSGNVYEVAAFLGISYKNVPAKVNHQRKSENKTVNHTRTPGVNYGRYQVYRIDDEETEES